MKNPFTEPFPDQWKDRLLSEIVGSEQHDDPFTVQLATFPTEEPYPEVRSVLLRYAPEVDLLFICSNMTYPKWEQLEANPNLAISSYWASRRLAIRVRATARLYGPTEALAIDAWSSMPEYHRDQYLEMGEVDQNGVSSIFGCIALDVKSWLFDQTGDDGWTIKREIYTRDSKGFEKTLERSL